MPNKTLNTRIVSRNDLAATWISVNPVLMKGEMGIEIDTKRIKIGDGVKTWTELGYANALPEDLSELGYGDMLKSIYDTNNDGRVNAADEASKLTTPRMISGVAFDGTADITLTKANVGLGNVDNTADLDKPVSSAAQAIHNATNVRVNALEAKVDVPTSVSTSISEAIAASEAKLGTAASKNVGVSVGNVVSVEANGKISPDLVPSVAITDTFTVNSEAEMLALSSAEKGDIAIRLDVERTFVLKANGYNVLANWVELKTPTDAVSSVNGQTGTVTLTTTNIAEGSNLYYTEARASANFATHASTELTDTDTLVRVSDTLILNGGNA